MFIAEKVAELRKTSDGDSSPKSICSETYHSGNSSLDSQEQKEQKDKTGTVNSRPTVQPGNVTEKPVAQQANSVAAKPDLSFAEAIEKINLRKEQEQLFLDGHEMIKLIKVCR